MIKINIKNTYNGEGHREIQLTPNISLIKYLYPDKNIYGIAFIWLTHGILIYVEEPKE